MKKNFCENKTSSSRASGANHLWEKHLQLRTKNKKLKYELDKSERLRVEMQTKLNALLVKDNQRNFFEKLMSLKRTHYLGIQDDKKAGILWNLADKIVELRTWDRWLVNIEHSSRDGIEHPVAILS